ncbi:DUF664 domain-containing protein [Streptomyces sp. BA2]|nr:DUF664 domain-containing protein [Streptomyces sp. BA2]
MVTHVNAEAPGDERGALLAFLDAELSLSGLLKHVAEVEESWG